MPFATNQDLVDYYPTALDHGVADWTLELARAEQDVKNLVKTRWFNQEFSRPRGSMNQTLPQFDSTLLTSSQWTRATVYRALNRYILPKLSTFRPEGDAFREQLAFFQTCFEDEFNLQMAVGVEYDLNDDGTVGSSEKFSVAQDRLYR
jgi:hypothetical protein